MCFPLLTLRSPRTSQCPPQFDTTNIYTNTTGNAAGSGSVEDGGFIVSIDGTPLVPGATIALVAGVDMVLELSGTDFRGHMFRLGRGAAGVETPDALTNLADGSQLLAVCASEAIAGVTHTDNGLKQSASATLTFAADAADTGVPLDVNVVVANCGTTSTGSVVACDPEDSTYYYSQYLIDFAAADAGGEGDTPPPDAGGEGDTPPPDAGGEGTPPPDAGGEGTPPPDAGGEDTPPPDAGGEGTPAPSPVTGGEGMTMEPTMEPVSAPGPGDPLPPTEGEPEEEEPSDDMGGEPGEEQEEPTEEPGSMPSYGPPTEAPPPTTSAATATTATNNFAVWMTMAAAAALSSGYVVMMASSS
jgi:hypothetical protein